MLKITRRFESSSKNYLLQIFLVWERHSKHCLSLMQHNQWKNYTRTVFHHSQLLTCNATTGQINEQRVLGVGDELVVWIAWTRFTTNSISAQNIKVGGSSIPGSFYPIFQSWDSEWQKKVLNLFLEHSVNWRMRTVTVIGRWWALCKFFSTLIWVLASTFYTEITGSRKLNLSLLRALILNALCTHT